MTAPGGGRAAAGGGWFRSSLRVGVGRPTPRGAALAGSGGGWVGGSCGGTFPLWPPLSRGAAVPPEAGLHIEAPCGSGAGLPREGFSSAPFEAALYDPSPAGAGSSVRPFLGVEGVY